MIMARLEVKFPFPLQHQTMLIRRSQIASAKAALKRIASPKATVKRYFAELDDLPGLASASGGHVDRLCPVWGSLGLPTEAYVFPYRRLRVGSICSGMGTETWAFARLPWKFQKAFWCEKEVAPRTFLFNNFGNVPNWRDCMSDEFQREAPGCDVLLSGFPCQPFSISGKGQGMQDSHGRGIVILKILQYIRKHLPDWLFWKTSKA